MMEMPEKLWDLANVVTGFAAVQSLATSIAMAKGDLVGSLRGPREHLIALIVTLIFSAFHIWAILWRGQNGMVNAERQDREIWQWVTRGRWLTVVLFALVMLGTLAGHYQTQIEKSRSVCNSQPRPPG